MNDRWEKLWRLVTDNPDGNARIEVTDNLNEVLLFYPDGSIGCWYWKNNDWHAHEALDIYPCDVAARDSL